MKIHFESIDEKHIKEVFFNFFYENCVFFEIIYNNVAIGFYGIKSLSEKICEISLYIYEKCRGKFTKEVTLKCLKFPFELGFDKIMIKTELEKMVKFLSKLKKHGVCHLFKHGDINLFEVING